MTLNLLKVYLQTFLFIPVTQKCQILSCDTLVANERIVYRNSDRYPAEWASKLSNLNEKWKDWQVFVQFPNIKFHKNPFGGYKSEICVQTYEHSSVNRRSTEMQT